MPNTRKAFEETSHAVLWGPMPQGTPLKKIKDWPWLIVDGGINQLLKKSQKTTLQKKIKQNRALWVGDGDSQKKPKELLPITTLLYSPIKDSSDLKLALNILKKAQEIVLQGFWGGDFSHQMGNIGEVSHFVERKKGRMAYFEQQAFVLSPGKWELSPTSYFSLLLIKKGTLSLKGPCQYQLLKKTIMSPFSSYGISNQWKKQGPKKEKVVLNSSAPILYLPSNFELWPKFKGVI